MEKPVEDADGVVALSYLFDRPRSDHPWLDALSELDRSPVIGEPQITANWRMDHRVDGSREGALLAPGGFPDIAGPDGESFRQARGNYFPEFLCRPDGRESGAAEPPVYLTHANRTNRIPAERVSPNHDLLRLVSLNALLRRALSIGYAGHDLKVKRAIS